MMNLYRINKKYKCVTLYQISFPIIIGFGLIPICEIYLQSDFKERLGMRKLTFQNDYCNDFNNQKFTNKIGN